MKSLTSHSTSAYTVPLDYASEFFSKELQEIDFEFRTLLLLIVYFI